MDQIEICDLEVFCHHGVFPEENVLGQKFLVSLILNVDTKKAGKTDDLNESVNYAEICHLVDEKLKEQNFKLIEAAAEYIAEELLLSYPLVYSIFVKIKKPWAPILLPIDTVSVSIERGWHTVYLSIGANLGDKEKQIKDAIELLKLDKKCKNVVMSSLIETKPYGYTEQPDFLNGAVKLETLYSPDEFLALIHKIEKMGKRERKIHWGPRTIDLDLIFYDDLVYQQDDLVIPHREMHKRKFVLQPLAEIAPYVIHPVFHKTVMELCDTVKEEQDD